MSTKMSKIPFRAETMFCPSSSCSRSRSLQRTIFGHNKRPNPPLCLFYISFRSLNNYRKTEWSFRSVADGSNSTDPSGGNPNNDTRLVRAIRSFQTKLRSRIKELRKGLSVKILFFLLGFYCATAFATVIGQTGDWDILSAGLAVVVVEGIGALMYRASFGFLKGMRGLITVFNYWKAGLSLGLFLDSFKYEMDVFFESCNPFRFDIDAFPVFW
ncbi:uncharacterized protein A4U43_C10F1690 [Asparagus officinalis]|uniref:Ycf20-like protein n=1 Tax=Asparagus officinalis TaxID=4686 RepID=A0A5P1E057_ASPOF|nr:uncharacterized protein LOC109825450 [Asparagus officinalis]ONK55858.1 uncharacterized protein A4U43_C10F1690 [Asparagus officinalis]